MAMSIQKGSGTGRGRHGRRAAMMAEINVTPMVDVMLVLLIIFMVAAPLMASGVPITLPKTVAKAIPAEDKPVVLTIRADGAVFIGEDELAPQSLLASIAALSSGNPDPHIHLRADEAVPYGAVASVMGQLAAAGYTHINLITEQKPEP